jgi:tetratricopeptide (TPR) repeat protein/predicted Ser/Thr protein kinase
VTHLGARLTHQVGPYRVLRPLAKGGMAEVYEVEDVASGEHLALKILTQTGGALPRFNREYEAMIRLNHPNIVRVYAYGLLDDLHWFSMELIDGTPIQACAKDWGKPGSDERLLKVAQATHDLALALDHIHRRGLVHRDLKSANVLVLPDGRVKLIDFGTARVSDPVEDITRDGEFIGTFAYASPEQLQNFLIDGRSDLYSLGVLLYRLVSGRRPFETDDIAELARLHVRTEPPPPSNWVPEIPPAIEELILKLLAKDPRDRLQTGVEVAEWLEQAMGGPLTPPRLLALDPAAELPLIGREDQFLRLWSFFGGQADGASTEPGNRPGDMALIVGLHGSGRHQVIRRMEQYALELQRTPLTLFFRRGAEDLDQVAQLANQLIRSFGPQPPASAAAAAEIVRRVERSPGLTLAERLSALKDAVARLLRARAQADRAPVIVFVRGLQHAGTIGFEALVALRESVRAVSARVLFIADLAENADHPGSVTRKRLSDALRIELPPMTVRQVALLVGAFLKRRPPPSAIARRIFDASGGLPAYVQDVTNRLLADGLLQQGRDQNRIDWAQHDDIDIPVPEAAQDRVLEEFAALPPDRRRCLETLALCGGEGSAVLLATALDCTGPELAPALRDLESRGWISLDRAGETPYARWRQVLAQDLVLEQLQICRRRVLERRVTEMVANEPPFVAQMELLVRAGRHGEAILRARDWAIHQLAKHRPLTALEALDVVMPLLDGTEPPLQAEMSLLHATALLLGSRPTDPRLAPAIERAARLFSHEDLLEAEVYYLRAQLYQVIGHYPRFREMLTEAWRLLEPAGPTALGASVATMLGWYTQSDGSLDEAAAWYGRARRIATGADAPVARANADLGVAGWQLAQGRLEEAERIAAGVLPLLQEADDLRGLSVAVPLVTESLVLQGRFSEAVHLLDGHLPVMRDGEVPTFYVRLLLAAATAEMALGRLGRAQEHVDELFANLRTYEHLELRLRANLVWGRIQVASGMHEDAQKKLREVEERARACGLTVIAETAVAARSEALWALGRARMAEAFAGFESSAAALEKAGDVPGLVQVCITRARAMCETVDPDRVLKAVAQWIDQPAWAVAQIEREIARGRHEWAFGRSARAFEEAQNLIERLAATLTETDAFALRLHPWTWHIRRARKGRLNRSTPFPGDRR